MINFTGEMSWHDDKVISVAGRGVLAAAASPRRVFEKETSGLLGRGGYGFGTLSLGKRLLQREEGKKAAQVDNSNQ